MTDQKFAALTSELRHSDEMLQAIADLNNKHEGRWRFLHSNNKDADGYEWCVMRVKWDKQGRISEALHTNQDLSDLDAAIAAYQTLSAQPNPEPTFTGIAARKLDGLKGRGYVVDGYSIQHAETKQRGFITAGGFVGWWINIDHVQPTAEPVELTALRKDFARECVDTDTLLRLLGFEPNEVRTEGGSLNLRRLANLIEARKTTPEPVAQAAPSYITYHRDDEGPKAAESYAAMCACLSRENVQKLANHVAHGVTATMGGGRIALTRDDWNDIVFLPLEPMHVAPSPVALQGRDELPQLPPRSLLSLWAFISDSELAHIGLKARQKIENRVFELMQIYARSALQAARASLPAGGVVEPWGWAIVDKHGTAQAIRPRIKEFFGSIQGQQAFTQEDVKKMDREWPGLVPHCLVTLYTTPQPSETQGRRQMTEEELVACLVKASCIGKVKMSFESGPYAITRPSLDATRLKDAIEAHHGIPASPQDGGEKA